MLVRATCLKCGYQAERDFEADPGTAPKVQALRALAEQMEAHAETHEESIDWRLGYSQPS